MIQSTVNACRESLEEVCCLLTSGGGREKPRFPGKRVYQGSSGTVYPYPVIEKIADEKKEKTYTALFIENRYIKVMIA